MSGFGGGFGNSGFGQPQSQPAPQQQAQPSGFGTPQQPTSGFGGGFGAAPSGGFGASPSSGFGAAPISGGFGAAGTAPPSGFGASPASGFGAAPSSGFGSAQSSGFGGGGPDAAGGAGTGGGFGSSGGTGVGVSSTTQAAAGAPSAFGTSGSGGTGFGGSNSGFGGGFGSSSVGFGGSNASGGSSGGGFGSAVGGGFGSSSSTAAATAGFAPAAGSGASSSSPWGSSTIAAPATSGFGSSTTQTTTSFGSAPSAFGASSTTTAGFGAGSPNPSSSTGNATPASASKPLAFGTSSSVAAPSTSSSAGFGSPSASFGGGGGFGSSSGTGGFGSSSTTNATTPTQTASSPFGAASTVGFGTSSSTSTSSGFGASQSTSANNTPHKPAFGESSSGFGGGGRNSHNNAFGGQQQQSGDDDMGDGDDSNNHDQWSSPLGGPRIPRKDRSSKRDEEKRNDGATPSSSATASSGASGDEQLALLRAKIQEKKKRLMNKMKKGDQSSEGSDNKKNEGGGISSNKTDSDSKGTSGTFSPAVTTSPPPPSNADLAAKNAIRFSSMNSQQEQALTKLLPADLKGKVGQMAQQTSLSSSSNDEGANNAWDSSNDGDDDLDLRNLSNAKSLVGVCMTMCPDEELLRREREGDIQLLEVTDPGGLHPEGWTLRDTAVKRFRRSAADFKLDIPELVRPPEVLERVCGYLEEWVMERDRQGPDKRFAQTPSNVPPPLDVYQFIWDRTRMIRKDFILQNYIGTGGKCDARAVRCHERIARWHAMCEHQLSHIPEFVTHQSQQNIAELGQTMKTLNLYYDDALGRALTELEDGAAKGSMQGCGSDIVMGKSPVDFDGSILSNNARAEDVANRIIGLNGINSSSLGTAEPEMRGLYILLTMNNEGGMEVLKYSGRLCVQRPEIFYSKPVQLALSIFQAKKEHNYARFFNLMRSPSTPYLFSCIMFKYVEQMRKDALAIMSRTYGAKHKTTGEPFFDSYPLISLVNLLCYEDEDEARTSCQHYGLTVEGDQVLWRHSKFTEPRDPVKGTIIALKPRKMIRTIESKLKGATRLSVCRGGVSGEGATLSTLEKSVALVEISSQSIVEVPSQSISEVQSQSIIDQQKALEDARVAEIERKKALKKRLEEEERKQKEEEARQMQEAIKKEAERQRLEAIAKEKARIEKIEIERQKKALEEKRRVEMLRRLEEERVRKEKEEARQRKEREREAARQRAEEARRQQIIAKKRAEEEQQRKLAEEAERRRRLEQEERRQAEEERRRIARELEIKRRAEEERVRKAKEAEDLRIEMMWRDKIQNARKIMIWRLWRRRIHKREKIARSNHSISNIDPTMTQYPLSLIQLTSGNSFLPAADHSSFEQTLPTSGHSLLENHIFRLATAPREPINLSKIIGDHMYTGTLDTSPQNPYPDLVETNRNTVLFKLGIVLPKYEPPMKGLNDAMLMWINSHLRLKHISTHVFEKRSRLIEIRTVTVSSSDEASTLSDCDSILVLLPSFADTSSYTTFSKDELRLLHSDIPKFVLVLDDESSNGINSSTRSILEKTFSCTSGSFLDQGDVIIPKMQDFDNAFLICCEEAVNKFLNGNGDNKGSKRCLNPSLARISISNLGFLCLQKLFQNAGAMVFPTNAALTDDKFFNSCRMSLASMVSELSRIGNEIQNDSKLVQWPPREFFTATADSIEKFFDMKYNLPSDWFGPLLENDVPENQVRIIFQQFFDMESFALFAEQLSHHVPPPLQRNIMGLLDEGVFSRCFANVVSIIVNKDVIFRHADDIFLYLPSDEIEAVINASSHYEDPTPHQSSSHIISNHSINFSDHLPPELEKEVVKSPPVKETCLLMNKRKSQEKSQVETQDKSNTKRKRTSEPSTVETKEEKQSKEFTSYLEALLY